MDMAVGVVIVALPGGRRFYKDLLMPLMQRGQQAGFSTMATVNNSVFAIGDFINTVVAFLLVAAAVYFLW
jgi:large conductance mechanosensitive channel